MRALLLIAGLAAACLASRPAAADDGLHELRATRRAAVKGAVLAKDGAGPATFGLLVIPVDFADARFAPGFNPTATLGPRLAGDQPGTLAHYYRVASRGRTELVIQLAPVVQLPGPRLDYSDLYWQGNERGRRLARLALERAAAFGVDFAASDRDQDGEVDGVLLLHAAPGLENDPADVIVPYQFYLVDAVVHRGTAARSFALASARSTLGIWAHETGHLLGLEDRYDRGLAGSIETGARGGLGRYSLMASGWLGSGAGDDPALPDAYSCLQLGWVDLAAMPGPGSVMRLLVGGEVGPEYFLATQAFPALTAPYDAALPTDRLLILHVDETLAEGQASAPDWPARHLRVNLVPADGNDDVARGLSQGRDADLFPSGATTQAFGDDTTPGSRTFDGQPSGVDLLVTSAGEGLVVLDRTAPAGGDLRLTFALAAGGVLRPELALRYGRTANLPPSVVVTVVVADTAWGRFADGATLTTELHRTDTDAGWAQYRDGGLMPWAPGDASPPPGAVTPFVYGLGVGATPARPLVWVWSADPSALDLAASWPGAWSQTAPGGDAATVWHRWLDGPADDGAMLACTGAAHGSGAAWPAVSYGNGAHVELRTPWLDHAVRWVSFDHAVDLELLHAGLAVDGVALHWEHAGGYRTLAVPSDGWLGRVDARPWHPLAGMPTFALADSLREPARRPLWRREVLPAPAAERHGPGPWRLVLSFASNTLFRARGWLVKDPRLGWEPAPDGGFPAWMDGDRLRWRWSGSPAVAAFAIETSADGGATWREAWRGDADALALSVLELAHGLTWARVVALAGGDAIASRVVLLESARAPILGAPWPNPARGLLNVAFDGAGDPRARLEVYDLRGRLVRRWSPGGAAMVVTWDGRDDAQRPVAAGVYLVRLLAHGRILTSKVTWLPASSPSS